MTIVQAPEIHESRATTALLAERTNYVPRGVSTPNPVFAASASGARLQAVDGREYIDFAAGIGTLNVGHAHPRVVAAVRDQASNFLHTCFHVGMYEGYTRLAARLAEIVPTPDPSKTLLMNSGAEAVENAVKIARVATGRSAILAFAGGFHGRTLLGLSLTGKEVPYKAQFGSLAPDIYRSPFPYPYRPPAGVASEDVGVFALGALEQMFDTHVAAEKVAAIIVEPVLGESGFIVPPAGFLPGLRTLCDRHGILLIVDEIQTGFGRTGRMFAVEHEGVVPDLLLLGKSLAGGLPLAAVVGRAEVMDAPEPGGLGGTFAGNPLSCAAALAVLDIFEDEHIVERAQVLGSQLRAGLEAMQSRYAVIGEVRGLGAMQAIELVEDRQTRIPAMEATRRIHDLCTENGLLLAKAGLYANVIRILAPLVADPADIDAGLAILDGALNAIQERSR
jgi:4-aminobutyrate aminotransferase/(S)-3-amino-2-methylpropionate transaminase